MGTGFSSVEMRAVRAPLDEGKLKPHLHGEGKMKSHPVDEDPSERLEALV